MTTQTSTESFTVTTVSGAVREIPENLVDEVVGLDSEGRIVIDTFGYLDAPKKGDFLFGLTLCCDAFDKGGEDSVYCRSCYGAKPNADDGAYLFAWETDGVYGYPELDPISDAPRPVRFEVRKDSVHRYWGVWDNEITSWNDGIHGDAVYAAGIPMWESKQRAREVAADLNAAAASLGEGA